MVRDIDDLADQRTRDLQSPGEVFHDTFLLKRPKTEWGPYLDETAKDLSAGIRIGDINLDGVNFGREVGSYYRRGLERVTGQYTDLPAVLNEHVDDEQLGSLSYRLNELSYEIAREDASLENIQQAVEAVVEKILARNVGRDADTTIAGDGGTVADIITQLFDTETVASNFDVILDEIDRNTDRGLLSLIDEPQMMTRLWDHQHDALAAWCENGFRGYVDMATATGKTVLGLGAIAVRYGELHPSDQDLAEVFPRQETTGTDDVLIVAHNDLILEQWRREFDRHLNIPRERTTGSNDISLTWGRIHFRTPQSLVNEDRVAYDLVLLDEAHHYATGSEWGSLLDEFDSDVLAMSGSVDDAGSDSERIKERLSNSIGPEIKRYTITDAKADGVIPSFDWEVHYAPYDVAGNDLRKIAERSEQAFTEFQRRLNRGEVSIDTDRRLRTYEDIRRFSHTTEGNELKQRNDDFRDLVTRLFSRRTKRWNLSPVLDSVVDLVVEHSTTEKVVVLADSNAQVEELESRLRDIVADSTPIYLVSQSQSRTEQRETIDAFDEPENAGILLGTGDLLGEGVDMQHASVAINMATGGVNPELVQRIGRVLRNPADTPKHAMFYNVVGVPPSIESAVSREDGKRIIEQAAGFCSLGGRFDKLPGFSTSEALDIDTLGTLLREGAEFIDTLDAEEDYVWDSDTINRDDLEVLQSEARSRDGDAEAILGAWEEYAWEHSKDRSSSTADEPADGLPDKGDGLDATRGQPQDAVPGTVESEDAQEVSRVKRQRIADLVQLQPTKNSELQREWALSSGREVHRYLQSELSDYYFRDSNSLIWASDEAEALVNGDPSRSRRTNTSRQTRDLDTQSDQEPSKSDLLDEIRRLNESLGKVPSKTEMTDRGEYAVDQYEAAFDTWSTAVKEAGFEPRGSRERGYTRQEVIEGLRDVASELQRSPSVSNINDHAEFSASVVYNYFDSLSEARNAAGVSDVSSEPDSRPDSASDPNVSTNGTLSGTSSDPTDDTADVSASPLAEYYEAFRNFTSLLDRIIESDRTSYRPDDDHPLNRWRDEIKNVVFGSGLNESSPCYGQQQGDRNPVKMAEYRRAFGDGEAITDYQCIQTQRLNGEDIDALVGQRIISHEEAIHIPVAPRSNDRLPIVVSSENDLDEATGLLTQFPAEPELTSDTESESPVERESEQAVSGSDPVDGTRTSNSADTDETPDSEDADSGTLPDEAGSMTEQAIFWDSDVEQITEYATKDAGGLESDGETASRRDALDKKIDEWKSQLLDLTRRNKLVSFKPTKTKSLPLDGQSPSITADALVASDHLLIRKKPEESSDVEYEPPDRSELDDNELLSTRTPDETADSLYRIGLYHKQYLRERGVDTLYLALGMLRWYSVDHSDTALRSPLFLAPVELDEKTIGDPATHNYVLKPKSEGLRFNPALKKKLQAEQDLDFPPDEMLSLNQIDAAFETVANTIRGYDRWVIQDDIVLGIFDFTKFSIYADLEENRDLIKHDPIVRALNDDHEPLQRAEGDITTPAAVDLDDTVNPVDVYQVLDADSSQQEAIEAAKRGKSFVLQGPPGTGKSQTIANIIAEKLADGEQVLFVSEKQAALDVVKDRLDNVGVGRFCLEVHGEKANNTDVLASLEDELKAGEVKTNRERVERLKRLRERRDALNRYGDRLFYAPPDWELTVYQAFGILAQVDEAPYVEIGIDDPLALSQETIEGAIEELETLAQFDTELENRDSHPWRHTTLTSWGVDTGDAMRRSLARQRTVLEDLEAFGERLEDSLGITVDSLADLQTTIRFLDHLAARPEIEWQEAFFEKSFVQTGSRLEELAELEQERAAHIADLEQKYERSFFSTDGAELTDELAGYGFLKSIRPSYRSLRSRILNHTRSDYDPGYDDLLEDTRKLAELQRLEDLRDDYRDVIDRLGPLYQADETDWETIVRARSWATEFDQFDDRHTAPVEEYLLTWGLPDVEELLERARQLQREYDDASGFFRESVATSEMHIEGYSYEDAPFQTLRGWLDELHDRVPALQRWVQFSTQLDAVRETVCREYIDSFLDTGHAASELVPAFKQRFYTVWLNAVYEDTGLGSFNAEEMEQYLEDFRQLDQEQQELAKVEIQHEVTKRRPTLNLEHASSSEQVTVRREIEKQRRHKPLRELFDEAGDFIMQLTPCLMMSPLSVAQYIKSGTIEFDTVIFDEASQIMPEDAISSLVRADQAVIAGDTKQLPPTSFFQSDTEVTEDVREDLDSILEEAASVLPEKHLRWHYRSRTKELIEFSNHQYYNGELRTFPENEPDVETGVEFEYVSDGVYDRGGSRQNETEAERVVDFVEKHAEQSGDKSLGVVAFSSAQEQAIRDVLEKRREETPVLDAFVSQEDVLDEFFIKNLEMVQGDERDRMIFSVGYGPDQSGTISMNFGPLNKSGGERRLNVAVTRARERVTVVSSLQPGDIDLTRTKSTGVEHFKRYLEYAKNGERALARDDTVTKALDFDSQFEEAVYADLKREGFDVVSQVQSASYSIDLAIKHPDRPGEFILGIECDGAAYHSSKTARDRDRIRQSVLEELGWTIHRIWSPDWLSNKEREIRAIKEKVQSLLDGVEPDGGQVTVEATDVRTYEPEETDRTRQQTEHEDITTYEEPSLSIKGDRSYSEISNGILRDQLRHVVVNHGPIKSRDAFRRVVNQWNISRLAKSTRQSLKGHALHLQRTGGIVMNDGFLWPPYEELDFRVRINNGDDTRDIDDIPLEEIAKAAALLLEEGGQMTRDDLSLETSRLFGYQRRGERIQKRIEAAIDRLIDIDAVDVDGQLSLSHDEDIDRTLLRNVYPDWK